MELRYAMISWLSVWRYMDLESAIGPVLDSDKRQKDAYEHMNCLAHRQLWSEMEGQPHCGAHLDAIRRYPMCWLIGRLMKRWTNLVPPVHLMISQPCRWNPMGCDILLMFWVCAGVKVSNIDDVFECTEWECWSFYRLRNILFPNQPRTHMSSATSNKRWSKHNPKK